MDSVHAKLPTSPMLLTSNKNKDTWNVYDIVHDKVVDFQARMLNVRFCGSSKGWLMAVDEDFVVTLINPFLRVEEEEENSIIRLPPLKPPGLRKHWSESGDKCQHFVYKATISADPIQDPTNCTVLAIYEELCQLAFFRLGKDTTWNYVDESWSLIQEVTHFKGKFYAVDFWGELFAFDITSSTNSNVETLVAREGKDWDYAGKSYLVSANEKELLMVRRYFDFDEV